MSKVSKDIILAAAATAFARHGLEGATLREIADVCEIQAPSLFHHFPGGKQAIYDAINQEVLGGVAHILTQVGQRAPAEALLPELARALWGYFVEHPEYAAMALREMLTPNQERLAASMGDAGPLIMAAVLLVQQQQEAGYLPQSDPRHLLFWLTSAIMGYFSLAGLHTVIYADSAPVDESYLDLILAMLQTTSGAAAPLYQQGQPV